ncbi:MAG TPA: molybdopterin-dependent oxidoreductase [Sporichthyaceae bacterium]
MSADRVALRTCPLCEATCGLEITLRPRPDGGEEVVRIRGDSDDVFSRGFICPKGSTLGQLYDDPDRIRQPLIRDAAGQLVEATWAQAWAAVDRGLHGVIDRHGREAVGLYFGNPVAHNLGPMLYLRHLVKALGSPHLYSASTLDQRPKEIAAALMFGSNATVPVPDVDRTDFLLVLGANPYASNGSLATAPDWPGRLKALRARGGRLVVVDPRRTRTAEAADQWVPIRPGTDAHLLAAMAHVLFAENLVDLGTVADFVAGVDEVRAAIADFTPESVASVTGIPADTIRDLALALVQAPTAAVYGRIGTTAQAFGTVASWLVDVLNIVTGNLDRPGGAMFPKPALGSPNTRGEPGRGAGTVVHRRHTRVRGLPEALGEFPAPALAEEIDTPGPGRLRGLITVAGNPVVSAPNAQRLDAALADLEFLVAVDIYVNETTRHADVILPVPTTLEKEHYDVFLYPFALRNVANWSDAVLPTSGDQPEEWAVLAKLALIAAGAGPDADPAAFDDATYAALARHAPAEVVAAVDASGRRGPARTVDLMLRTGPYGLSLDDLLANPHGIDLGALEPRLPGALRTPSGCVEMAPPLLLSDLTRLRAELVADATAARPLLLIGRRHLRSNNSWMHNLPALMKGSLRCTVLVHPEDAARRGLIDGELARVAGRVGEVVLPVEITDEITPGVVSIPHGWGHDAPDLRLRVASRNAGINSNLLSDDQYVDALSGTAVFNGIPVTVTHVGGRLPRREDPPQAVEELILVGRGGE